ncbi:hypothetical protein MCI89_00010 [Muricomes sp. OA1]|nr:hypothetical protein [Muricomes sp. OA1]
MLVSHLLWDHGCTCTCACALGIVGYHCSPPLLAFGVVVGGLAAILGAVGKKLQASAVGVAVFAATVSVMAWQ